MLDGLPARVARRLRRHPILVDTALAMATVSVSLALGHQEQPAGMRPFDLLGYALTCLASLTLVFRRRWPGLVCVGYCVAWYCGTSVTICRPSSSHFFRPPSITFTLSWPKRRKTQRA